MKKKSDVILQGSDGEAKGSMKKMGGKGHMAYKADDEEDEEEEEDMEESTKSMAGVTEEDLQKSLDALQGVLEDSDSGSRRDGTASNERRRVTPQPK